MKWFKKNWMSLGLVLSVAALLSATLSYAVDPVQLKVGTQSDADGSLVTVARAAKTGEYVFCQSQGR